MSQTLNAAVAVIGIDIGKNSFHIVGHDERGAICAAPEVVARPGGGPICRLPPCLIGMEACVGASLSQSHTQWSCHDARLMPATYVRHYQKGRTGPAWLSLLA